jgi:hypothetical protein
VQGGGAPSPRVSPPGEGALRLGRITATTHRDAARRSRRRADAETHHIESLVAVERCDRDRDDVSDFRKASPKSVRQRAPADARLEAKASEWRDFGHGAAVRDQAVVIGVPHRSETQQRRAVAVIAHHIFVTVPVRTDLSLRRIFRTAINPLRAPARPPPSRGASASSFSKSRGRRRGRRRRRW